MRNYKSPLSNKSLPALLSLGDVCDWLTPGTCGLSCKLALPRVPSTTLSPHTGGPFPAAGPWSAGVPACAPPQLCCDGNRGSTSTMGCSAAAACPSSLHDPCCVPGSAACGCPKPFPDHAVSPVAWSPPGLLAGSSPQPACRCRSIWRLMSRKAERSTKGYSANHKLSPGAYTSRMTLNDCSDGSK
jgi:hypothetical protein